MTFVTDVNGKQAEAFDLIMRKEFAFDIIEGRKRIEFRNMSQFYLKRFINISGKGKNEKWTFKDTNYIHFHDYGNTWFLDVRICDICLLDLSQESLGIMHEYGHHEFDEMAKECKEDEVNMFGLAIESILGTSLVNLSDIETGGKVKVAPLIP